MSSDMPVVRTINKKTVIIQLVILVLLSGLFYIFDKNNYIIEGPGAFFILSMSLRQIIPRYHRKGIALYKKEKYEDAIKYFEMSNSFFTKHLWLDKYRHITMLSSSKYSYQEMSQINIAFCLGQLGRKNESIEKYREILNKYPNNKMAQTSLKMME